MKKKLGERIKELFAQTADEASKILDEAPEEKKEDKKEEAKDDGAYSFDELVKAVKDLGEKVSAMAGKKEEKSEDEPDSADKEKKVDEEKKSEDEPKSLEDRLSALEAALAKLMEGKSMAGDEEEEEESVEDDDAEEEVVTGDTSDTASRAEILAPGIKLTKDVKAQALKQAYATKDGKVAIDTLTGGKPLKLDSAEAVELLFVGVSEMLKASRTKEFSKSKQVRDFAESPKTPMTAERMNEINAARYKLN